jgi:hypothetical protein
MMGRGSNFRLAGMARDLFQSSICGYRAFQAPFVVEAAFSLPYVLDFFVKNQLAEPGVDGSRL